EPAPRARRQAEARTRGTQGAVHRADRSHARDRRRRWRIAAIGLAGAAIAAAVLMFNDHVAAEVNVTHVHGYVRFALQPRTPLEKMIAAGDGQAFLAIARDPTVRHPEVFMDGPGEAAYRA